MGAKGNGALTSLSGISGYAAGSSVYHVRRLTGDIDLNL